ncbi:MAG: HAMP domain-containing protein [Thermoplasmata archaeon]|nr:HAMP domain-containing protein [Thermoplasmata archaeon]
MLSIAAYITVKFEDVATMTLIISLTPVITIGGLLFGLFFSKIITRSTNKVLKISNELAKGNFNVELDDKISNDEMGDMLIAFNSMRENIASPMIQLTEAAQNVANGDLSKSIDIEAKGTIKELVESFKIMQDNLRILVEDIENTGNLVASTSQEISSSSEEMNASAQEISSALQQISRGSQSQAEQVEQTANIMKEMTISVGDVAIGASSAAESAGSAKDISENGRKAVQESITKMQEIQSVVNESAEIIGSLGRRSDEIGQIVDVITSISDQTNLLALNAAIEAARAGDQGRGFAVVAEEVKNLAEDSRAAAERISQMIKQIRAETVAAVNAMERGTKEVDEGMVAVNTTGEAFDNIASITAKTADEIQEISNSSESQKAGTDMVAMAIDEIANIAEETSSATEESASSTEELTASMEEMTAQAQELSEMALSLQTNVSRFNLGKQKARKQKRPASRAKRAISPGKRPLSQNMEASLKKRGIRTRGD